MPWPPFGIDMRETVFAARDLLKHATRGIVTIGVSCSKSTGSVLADAIQIEQVLLNLVINAVDAMPAGGEIAIQTEAVALTRKLATRVGEVPAGDYVELTVSDNGSGMDAAARSYLRAVLHHHATRKRHGARLSHRFGHHA